MTADVRSGDPAAGFGQLRPNLMRVAYRMLGSVSDAEDIVQEAFIRWMRADRSDVRKPEAFLRRTVTRLCLDQLKSARRTREIYIGPWLPDPVVEEDEVEDVTLPLMLVLERARRGGLSPARSPRAQPCPSGEAPLQGGKAAWPRACRGFFRSVAQRRHEGVGRDVGG